jgi:hypothetical protein
VATLYHRILGEAFECLPETLRGFHGQAEGGMAEGIVRVTRGKGWFRERLADLLGLPPGGDQLPLRLWVAVEGEGERWTRHFGDVHLETTQWMRAGLLIEAVGPMRFGYRLVAVENGFRFQLARRWLGHLPLPAAFSPRIWGEATGCPGGWRVDARVDLPLLGLLIRYEGCMTPR